MAQFNLTAQIQLQAPGNSQQVIDQIRRQLSGINVPVDVQVNTRNLADANRQLQNMGRNANNAGRGMGILNRNLTEAARRFSVITIATGSFIALTRAIKNSLGTAVEFQREMVKISQVTGDTVDSLSGLSNEVGRLSTSLGVGNQSLLETARVLSQAGFSALKTKQALEVLANTTLAPSFDNIIDTTEGAIAILNQFGREAKKTGQDIQFLERALDAINQVSKNFAVESADLITAVRRTGGVFEAAGGSINELIALFTSVRQTTRESAETIATGFRTIFTRLQRKETIEALEELGIALTDAEGKFVGPLKAVEALAIGLAGLDPKDIRFNEIVEQLGGFRQIGKVIPLIKQYSVAQEALAVANASSGSTAKDAITAQQALAVQFEKVKQQFDKVLRTFAESETFQGLARTILDLATAFLKFAESLERVLPQLTAFAALKLGRGIAPGLLNVFGGGARRNMGGRIHGYSGGGWVPGTGSRDTVPAMLTPGEFVIKKSSAAKLGAGALEQMNARGYASGGKVMSTRNAYGPTSPRGPRFGETELVDSATSGIRKSVDIAAGRSSAGERKLKDKDSSLIKGQIFQAIKRAEAANLDDELTVGAAVMQPTGVDEYNFRSDLKVLGANAPGAKEAENIIAKKIRSTYQVNDAQVQQVLSQARSDAKNTVGVNMYVGSISKGTKEKIQSGIPDALADRFTSIQSTDLPGLPGGFNKGSFKTALQTANYSQVEGGIFEAFLAGVSNAPFNAAGDNSDTWDFPFGLGAALAKAMNLSEVAGNTTDAKRSLSDLSLGSVFKKAATTFIENEALNIANNIQGIGVQKANKGGSISGSGDSVPALLTPGEFVVKKSAAQSIGYSNLNTMNNTGVAKFAKGGAVGGYFAKFAGGGTAGGGAGGSGAIPTEQALITNTQQLAQARDNARIVTMEVIPIEEALQVTTKNFNTKRQEVVVSLGETLTVEELLQKITRELTDKRKMIVAGLAESTAIEESLQNNTKQLSDRRNQMRASTGESLTFEEQLQSNTKQLSDRRNQQRAAGGETLTLEEHLQAMMRTFADRINRSRQETAELIQCEEQLCLAMKQAADRYRTAGRNTNCPQGNMAPVPAGGDNAPVPVGPGSGSAGPAPGSRLNQFGSSLQRFGGALNQVSGALIGLSFVAGTLIEQDQSLTEAQKKVKQAFYNTIGVYGGLATQFASLGLELISSLALWQARRAAMAADIATTTAGTAVEAADTAAQAAGLPVEVANTTATGSNTLSRIANTIATNAGTAAALALGLAIMAVVGIFVYQKAKQAEVVAGFQNLIDAANAAADAELEKVGTAKGGADRQKFIAESQSAVTGEIKQKAASEEYGESASGALLGGIIGFVVTGLTTVGIALAAFPEPFTTAGGLIMLAIAGIGAIIGSIIGAGDPAAETADRFKALAPEIDLATKAAGRFAAVTYDSRQGLYDFGEAMNTINDDTLNATQKLQLLADATGDLSAVFNDTQNELEKATNERLALERRLVSKGVLNPFDLEGEAENIAGDSAQAKAARDSLGVLKELRKKEKQAYAEHNKILEKLFQQEQKIRTESLKAFQAYLNELVSSGRGNDVATLALLGTGPFGGAGMPQDLGTLANIQARGGTSADIAAANDTRELLVAIQDAFAEQRRILNQRFDSQIEAADKVGDRPLAQNLRQQQVVENNKLFVGLAKAQSDMIVATLRNIVATKREELQRLRLRQILERSLVAIKSFNDVLLNAAANTARNFQIIGNVIDGVSGGIQISGAALDEDLQNVSSSLLNQTLARTSINVRGTRGGPDFDSSNFTSGIVEAKKLIDAIPSTLEGESLDLSKPVNQQIDDLKKKLESATGIADIRTLPFGDLIMTELERMVSDQKGGKVDAKAVEPLIKLIQDSIEPNLEVLKKSIEIQNQYLAQINKINKAIVEAQGRFVEAVAKISDTRADSRDRVAEARGDRRSTADRERDRLASARIRLAGTGARAGDVASTLNAARIQRDRSRDLKQQGDDIAAGRRPGDGTGLNQLNRLDKEAQQSADAFNRARAELERLADQSALASDVMADIQEEQKKRQQLQKLGEDIAFGSDDQRKSIAQGFNNLQKAVAQGGIQNATEEERSSVLQALDSLPDVLIGNTGKTGKELKAQFQADEILRLTGNRQLAQASFDQAMAGSTEERLLNQLSAIGAEEAKAREALAQLEQEEITLLRVIAQNTERGFEADLRGAQAANATPAAQAQATQNQINQAQTELSNATAALTPAVQRNNELTEKLNKLNEQLIDLRQKETELRQTSPERQQSDEARLLRAEQFLNDIKDQYKDSTLKPGEAVPEDMKGKSILRVDDDGNITNLSSSNQQTLDNILGPDLKERVISTDANQRVDAAPDLQKPVVSASNNTLRMTGLYPTPASPSLMRDMAAEEQRTNPDMKPPQSQTAPSGGLPNFLIDSGAALPNVTSAWGVFIDEVAKDINNLRTTSGVGGTVLPSVQYSARGGSIFKPKGTDTVPAMLTPGEFVVRKSAVDKIGVGTLTALNNGNASTVYKANGGIVGGGGSVSGAQLPPPNVFQDNLKMLLNSRGKRAVIEKSLSEAGFKDTSRIVSAMYALGSKGVISADNIKGGKEFDQAIDVLRGSQYLVSASKALLRYPDTSMLSKDLSGAQQAITVYDNYAKDLLRTGSDIAKYANNPYAQFVGALLKNSGVTKENTYDQLAVLQQKYMKRGVAAQKVVGKLKTYNETIQKSQALKGQADQTISLMGNPTDANARQQIANLKTLSQNEQAKINAASNAMTGLLFGAAGIADKGEAVNKAADDAIRDQDFAKRTQGIGGGFKKQLDFLYGTGLLRLAQGGGVSGQDSIPAMLTPGEFVMSPEAVQKHGVGYMKSLNRGRVPGFRRGGLVGRGNVAYRQTGSTGPESGGGTILQIDPGPLQAVLDQFNANFGVHVDNIMGSLSSFAQAASSLGNVIQKGMDVRIVMSGDLNTAVKLDGDQIDHLNKAITNSILPDLEQKVGSAIKTAIKEMKEGT